MQEVNIGVFIVNPKPKCRFSLTTFYILQRNIKCPIVYLVSLGFPLQNCPFSKSSLPDFFTARTASGLLAYSYAIWHSARSIRISSLLDALYSPLGSHSSNNTMLPFIILQPQCRTNWQELRRKERQQLRGKRILLYPLETCCVLICYSLSLPPDFLLCLVKTLTPAFSIL